jgi:hypothetical protein
VVEETLALLKSGVAPTDFLLDSTVKTLRDRSVRWTVLAHDAIILCEVDILKFRTKQCFRQCRLNHPKNNLYDIINLDNLMGHFWYNFTQCPTLIQSIGFFGVIQLNFMNVMA